MSVACRFSKNRLQVNSESVFLPAIKSKTRSRGNCFHTDLVKKVDQSVEALSEIEEDGLQYFIANGHVAVPAQT